MTENDADAADDEGPDICKDELFHILQNERRRQVLRYVVNREGPFEMRAIAEQVAAWEHDTTVRQLSSDQRQRVYIALYQSHLDKLDEVGLIEYQQSRGIVEVTDRIEVVVPYLEGIEESEPAETDSEPAAPDSTSFAAEVVESEGSGTKYYAGATFLSLAVTAGAWANLGPASLLGGVALAMVVIGIFSVTTIAALSGTHSVDE